MIITDTRYYIFGVYMIKIIRVHCEYLEFTSERDPCSYEVTDSSCKESPEKILRLQQDLNQ